MKDFWKVYIVLLTLFLLVTTFFWCLGYIDIFFNPPFNNPVLYSESELNIFLSDELKSDLVNYWNISGSNEYGICVSGGFDYSIVDSSSGANSLVYNLDSSSSYVEGDLNSVDYFICPGSFASLHKHFIGGCTGRLNSVDVVGAESVFASGYGLYLIQCDVNKLEVYTRDNLYQGKILVFDGVLEDE